MAKSRKTFDSVRASRDGHEFHEAWVARKCLGLLLPKDDFVGLAIEGFSSGDQSAVATEANEIADAVLYYGERALFEHARQVVVVQVKYSKAAELKPFRAADAKKTLEKFAITYRSLKKKHGVRKVRDRLRFELVTNRPILLELKNAISGLRTGADLHGIEKTQSDQIKAACKLQGKDLTDFVGRLQLSGFSGGLQESKHKLAMAIADWSPAYDSMARIRLNAMRELARDKANLANQNRNVIVRVDVLTALELQDEGDLLPCPSSFPEVGEIVERQQLAETVAKIPLLSRPLVIHADGGVGKTVFMNAIAGSLAKIHEVVLFDCFGMGQYRAPEDARHQPRRGLIHIANELACRGLCDPLLPTADNSDDLVRAFRARLEQAAQTVRRTSLDKQLILLIDAIDNASEIARDRGEVSFPRLILESFSYGGIVSGVQVIVSSRSHRRLAAIGGAECEELELNSFTISETSDFLRSRFSGVADPQVLVAQSRSRGNARILEHLTKEGVSVLAGAEMDNVIKLDDLLRKRISDALREARKHGYKESDIKAFLAGLATLPPPVPVQEFSKANNLSEGAVNSFAADLSPLLEQTKHGLMFRDEPTETLIRDDYAADENTLRLLAKNLNEMQATSVYAATTLPDLLQKLEDGEQLFRLAFDERLPEAIKSKVGQQAIRLSRLRAAVAYSASRNELERLVHLLTELSTLAAIDQRGAEYILDNPELTVLSGDADSVRRLFEIRTAWPGARHARLAIAHALMTDVADAYRHAQRVSEWRRHYFQQPEDYQRENGSPAALDMASIPFCFIVKGDGVAAARDMAGWLDWYAFDVAEILFPLIRIGVSIGCIKKDIVHDFLIAASSKLGVLTAAIPFSEDDISLQRLLITSLAQACESGAGAEFGEKYHRPRTHSIVPGLLTAASIAVVLGMNSEAITILSVVKIPAPSLHSYMSGYWVEEVFPFIARQVLFCVANGDIINERYLLPSELIEISTDIPAVIDGQEFKKALKDEMDRRYKTEYAGGGADKKINYDTKSSADRFLDSRLDSWLRVSRALGRAFESQNGSLTPLLDVWLELRSKSDYYSGGTEAQQQHDSVGERLLTFALRANPRLDEAEVFRYVKAVGGQGVTVAANLIEVVRILAARPTHHALAGATAITLKAVIEREDDVSQRATLFGRLAQAISPAAREEAVEYFRKGLEQMDAIGSGDYQFVNELMRFSSSISGEELADQDSHTLSNIFELNLGEERKFNWGMYGEAMASTSGLRGISKLARWEDREKVSLDYTLLPYLKALLENGKIDPEIALTMMRVSDPAELWCCGTQQLIETLEKKGFDKNDILARELISQYRQNNPSGFGADTPIALARFAKKALGESSQDYAHLSALAPQIKAATRDYNELNNWRPQAPDSHAAERQGERDAAMEDIDKISAATNPLDELSVARALEAVDDLSDWNSLNGYLFERLRSKVPFSGWSRYIEVIARQREISLNEKINEISACKVAWEGSSSAVTTALNGCADIIVRENAFEFISFEHLSISDIKKLSEISAVDQQSLMLGLIKEFSRPNERVPASVWLSLATDFNVASGRKVGQDALKRLLNSGSAKLASLVEDGTWNPGLYAGNDQIETAAGLIWFALGSPHGKRRWMAAHSLRAAVRLGSVNVLDALIARFDRKDAAPFQAPELPFFYLHAQLWLLLTLARIALDTPEAVSSHHTFLEKIALDETDSHVLRKHFAKEALIACAKAGQIILSRTTLEALAALNKSKHSFLTSDDYGGNSFYQSRPEGMPKPEKELRLEYDFDKYQISNLSNIFGVSRWHAADALNAWVRGHDSEITHMSDFRGRPSSRRDRGSGITAEHHSYGQYLCWHALHAVAGEFLAKHPIVLRPHSEGSPWDDWLDRHLLTHDCGLWLADGTDWRPIETRINLREAGDTQVVLTGDPGKLLSLLNIEGALGEYLVVDGNWRSIDGIEVNVQSALVPAGRSMKIAESLAKKDPFQIYLPRLEVYEDDDPQLARSHQPFIPWVVSPSVDSKLDEADILGVVGALQRGRFSHAINAFGGLVAQDSFGRIWCDPSGRIVVNSEAWSQYTDRDDAGYTSGTRMLCNSDFVKNVLVTKNAHLLLVVVLRRYESGFGSSPSKFWHTTAVVRVTDLLDFTFHPGFENKLHKSQF